MQNLNDRTLITFGRHTHLAPAPASPGQPRPAPASPVALIIYLLGKVKMGNPTAKPTYRKKNQNILK